MLQTAVCPVGAGKLRLLGYLGLESEVIGEVGPCPVFDHSETKGKVFNKYSPISEKKNTALWKVPRLHPFVLVRATWNLEH
jgi:hypothetical protein